MSKKRIAVILVDRANYGRLKPVMEAIRKQPALQMQVVCSGSMVLERFGSAVDIVRHDGFRVESEVYIELEGSTPMTMAKSLGFAVIEFASEFQRLKPDIVLIIGDRFEALSAALAASYMNLCIAHIQGGEVSGSIDESARHCITKLAHYHFPATERSREYLIQMGEEPKTIFMVGCPSGDIALKIDRRLPPDVFNNTGIGGSIDPHRPYLLIVFHPITTKFGSERDMIESVLDALLDLQMPTVWLWPNIDAGADRMSKTIRGFRERSSCSWLRLIKNFPPETYLKVLANATCAVGNSSSFVRDASFFGTPVVLVGDRQDGRETAENIMRVEPRKSDVVKAMKHQLEVSGYPSSKLYGDGYAAERIAAALVDIKPYVQKRLAYKP